MRQVSVSDLSAVINVRQDDIDDFIESHTRVVKKKSRAEDRTMDSVAASLLAAQKISDAMHEIDGQHGSISVTTDTVPRQA